MTTHKLKTWRDAFEAVMRGDKRHEYRVDDRSFKVGDVLILQEFDHCKHCAAKGYTGSGEHIATCHICKGNQGVYTGRELRVTITYINRGGEFGIPDCYVAMTIKAPGDFTATRGVPRE